LARITHGVTRQLTTWPPEAVNPDWTVKATGIVSGSVDVLGAPGGPNSPLVPVVKGTVCVSQSVRSAVHSRRVPPVVSTPKWRPVT
jgi:hypothetical protein